MGGGITENIRKMHKAANDATSVSNEATSAANGATSAANGATSVPNDATSAANRATCRNSDRFNKRAIYLESIKVLAEHAKRKNKIPFAGHF